MHKFEPQKQFDRDNSSHEELKAEVTKLKRSGARDVPVYLCGVLHNFWLRNGTTLAELLAQMNLDPRQYRVSAGGKSGRQMETPIDVTWKNIEIDRKVLGGQQLRLRTCPPLPPLHLLLPCDSRIAEINAHVQLSLGVAKLQVFMLKRQFGSREPVDYLVHPYQVQKQFRPSNYTPEEVLEEDRSLKSSGAVLIRVEYGIRRSFWLSGDMMLAELVAQLSLDPRLVKVRAGGSSGRPLETRIDLTWTHIEIEPKALGGTEEESALDKSMAKLTKNQIANASNPSINNLATKTPKKKGNSVRIIIPGELKTDISPPRSTASHNPRTPRGIQSSFADFDRVFWPLVFEELGGKVYDSTFFQRCELSPSSLLRMQKLLPPHLLHLFLFIFFVEVII